ncbi:TPR-like protein [Phlebopus sp. FC_14]|nr:TPR-like protein [Phlebopus sp. FC_14]
MWSLSSQTPRAFATPAALYLRSSVSRSLSSRTGRFYLHTRSAAPRPSSRRDIRAGEPCINLARRWATSTTPHSSASDPAEVEAMQCLEQGTQKLEEGDVQGAKGLYKRSVEIKRNASSLFNLGVTHYHLKEYDDAIAAWKESIALQPTSPDAHTNLASAYIISPVSRPDLALHHLHIAASLSPEDPEIAFNLGAVLEATGQLEEALIQYKRSKENGVERAAMHIRNVSAKIFGKTISAAQEGEKPGSSKKSDS